MHIKLLFIDERRAAEDHKLLANLSFTKLYGIQGARETLVLSVDVVGN